MDFLEEFMPGMGDVLAAQEHSLTSVLATITTQMQQLALTNERQAQRVAQLESTQLTLRLALRELQNVPAPAPQVVEVLAPPDPAVAEAVAALSVKMEQLHQDVKTQVSEQMQQALAVLPTPTVVDDSSARMLLEEKVVALERKVVAEMGTLRNEATDSLAKKTRATEEAFHAQLEQLEKRFEYLSRVKMEVKEIMRRADRQEQSIEDVRTGIEMLAKSLGSDDIDSESNDEAEEADGAEEEEEPAEADESESTTKENTIPVLPIGEAATADGLLGVVEAEESKSQHADGSSHDVNEFASDSAVPLHSGDLDEMAAAGQGAPTAGGKPTTQSGTEALTSAIVAQKQNKRHRSKRKTDLAAPAQHSPKMSEVSEPEAAVEPQIDDALVAASTPAILASQQSEGERTTETVVVVPEAPAPVPVPTPTIEPTTSIPTESTVEHTEQEKQQDQDVKVGKGDDGIKEDEHEAVRDVLPQQYRSRMVSQQKQLDDELDLFRSSPNSAPAMRPNSLTSVVRARRQRRNTSARKESEFQLTEPTSTSMHESLRAGGSRAMSVPVHKFQTQAVPSGPRTPLTKEVIKELWFTLFAKLVRLQRLRQLNGINAERALFRRQPMSMGMRVKRLEETTGQLGDALEYLERNVHDNGSAINALDESIVEIQPVVEKVRKMERLQKTQARTIVDVEEKIQELDVEIQRLRTSSRRNSSLSSNVTTAMTNAISAQLQDVSTKFTSHITAFDSTEKIVTQVTETEIPAIHEKIELSLYTLRQEAEQRATEATLEVQKIFEQLQTSRRSADGNLVLRITEFSNRIYHTLLGMSGAILQSAELSKVEQSPKKSTRAPLNVGIELLQGIFTHFTANCKALSFEEATSEIDFLVEIAAEFLQQLEKLKGQAAIAKAAAQSLTLDTGGNNDTHSTPAAPPSALQHSSFDDHLVFMTTAKLKELESALSTRRAHKDGNQTAELTLHLNDVVVQVRSVLFLLLLHAETMDSHHQVDDLRSSQALIQNKVVEHGFAIGQLESTAAMVKLMNSRLDAFMEFSFAYAKEEDVKKSIQELITANTDMRDLVTGSLEATRNETLERDGLLGEEMNQLIARVSKKLDKDELLWTQEVLERQVQNVANASLDEHDLVDIHRRLRRKVDQNQLKSLLMDQRSKIGPNTGTLRYIHSNTEDGSPKAALVGAKCISCQGELPPTKAMIKNVVREEVQQEIAKSRAQKLPPSSLSTFNASNHRNLESFKRELLLSSLQQQRHSTK